MRKPARRLRILAIALGGVLLLSEPAEIAFAHEFDAGSFVSLSASRKKVRRGKLVILSGKVNSDAADCVAGREVLVSGARVAKVRTTDGAGNFSVRVRPRNTASYVAQIVGTISGVHPHRHACGGDLSNSARVRVKRS